MVGSESWNVDVSTLNVYGNPIVSREDTINNIGMAIVHSFDSRVFGVGRIIPLTFADQNLYVEVTYLGNMVCTINSVSTPEPVVEEVPCPVCEQYLCEAFATDSGAEVVTYPLSVEGYFVVIARGLNYSLPNAVMNGDYQIAFYITGAVRDELIAGVPADVLITEYGVPCSVCIMDWGVTADGAVFYGIGLTEFDAALAIAASRGVDLSQEIMREAHSVAVQWHQDQLDGPTPFGWYVP